MRDIIWTLILVWLVYKVVDLFKINSAKRSHANNGQNKHQQNKTSYHTASRPEKDIKNALKKHLNTEGEYIDFEELK